MSALLADGDTNTHIISLLYIMGQWEDNVIATLVHRHSIGVLHLNLAYIYIVCTVEVGNKFIQIPFIMGQADY